MMFLQTLKTILSAQLLRGRVYVTIAASYIGALLAFAGFVSIARADVIVSNLAATVDAPMRYEAIGTVFTTTDNMAPAGIDGPFAAVAGVNWRFEIKHVGGFNAAGATNVRIGIQGDHLTGPHQPPLPVTDVDPNPLPLRLSGIPGFLPDIPFGMMRVLTASTTDDHATNVLFPHLDRYALRAHVTAVAAAAGNQLAGDGAIVAIHSGPTKDDRFLPLPSFPQGFTFGSSSGAGSTVSFVSTGPGSGFLRFAVGAIDILDGDGGRTGGVEPVFASDPARFGMLIVDDLPFLGVQPNGSFLFGRGNLSFVDPAGKFTFDGRFPEYIITDTTQGDPLTSYGLLDALTITDVGDPGDGPSFFLEQFADRNIFGVGMSPTDFEKLLGIDFGFITSVNLAAITDNFSRSALNVPATYRINANGVGVPEPASYLTFVTGLAGLLSYCWRQRQKMRWVHS